MSDKAYENALKRQAELKQELLEVEAFIRLWHRFSGAEGERPEGIDVSQITTADIAAAANRLDAHRQRGQKAKKVPRGLPRDEVARYAREMMIEAGHPLTRGDLVEGFRSRGLPVGGTEPERNMGTIMWRLADQFVNLDGLGYWPKDRSYPPANYPTRFGKVQES
jgi:hypothetical protein